MFGIFIDSISGKQRHSVFEDKLEAEKQFQVVEKNSNIYSELVTLEPIPYCHECGVIDTYINSHNRCNMCEMD